MVARSRAGMLPVTWHPMEATRSGQLAGDVVGWHSALAGDDRAALIGHDWGAVTAYLIAAHRPELFRRIVTLAVPPATLVTSLAGRPAQLPRELPLLARQLRMSWYMFFQLLPGVSELALLRMIPRLWRAWSPGYDAWEDVPHVLAALPDPRHRTAALRYYRALLEPRNWKAPYV